MKLFQPGDRYTLPSGSVVEVQEFKHMERVSCRYVQAGAMLQLGQRERTAGVSFLPEFLFKFGRLG